MKDFDKKVYEVVKSIPVGYVMNYAMVAEQ